MGEKSAGLAVIKGSVDRSPLLLPVLALSTPHPFMQIADFSVQGVAQWAVGLIVC